jgi:hypothetical protein
MTLDRLTLKGQIMNYFFTQKVTGPESLKNPKSHGAILDNIAIIGIEGLRHMGQTYGKHMRVCI